MRDQSEAIRRFRKAADKGDALGQGLLGSAYRKGLGVPTDREKAIHWLQKAAAQGNDVAKKG